MKVVTPVTPISEEWFSSGEPVLTAMAEAVIYSGGRYGFTIPFPEASDEWFNGKPPAWWDETEWDHYLEDVFPSDTDIPNDALKFLSTAELGYKITVTDAKSKNVGVVHRDLPPSETHQCVANTELAADKVA